MIIVPPRSGIDHLEKIYWTLNESAMIQEDEATNPGIAAAGIFSQLWWENARTFTRAGSVFFSFSFFLDLSGNLLKIFLIQHVCIRILESIAYHK